MESVECHCNGEPLCLHCMYYYVIAVEVFVMWLPMQSTQIVFAIAAGYTLTVCTQGCGGRLMFHCPHKHLSICLAWTNKSLRSKYLDSC